MADTFTVEILEDGTIKTTTDPISPANHQSAEAFCAGLTMLTGGAVTRQRRGRHQHHHHHHEHQTQGNK
jgi:hypothetical protein